MLLKRVLKFRLPMMVGEDVRTLQQALSKASPSAGLTSADGIFGKATRGAVEAFQKDKGLDVDGKVGENTWHALFGEDASAPSVSSTPTPAAASTPIANKRPGDEGPPLNATQAQKVAQWLHDNFAGPINQAIVRAIQNGVNTEPPLDFATIAAMAAKETGFMFLPWTKAGRSADEILKLCIGDASGDVQGTSRNAFPKNREAFEAKFAPLSSRLLAAANAMRVARTPPMRAATLLYKGYGIFQYDLQHIAPDNSNDVAFFRDELWGDMAECLARVTSELENKHRAARLKGDTSLQETVRRYNGGGDRARLYSVHVMTMREHILATPLSPASAPGPSS